MQSTAAKDRIKQLRDRHIARLLNHLGPQASSKEQEDIKRSFGWLTDDICNVIDKMKDTDSMRSKSYEPGNKDDSRPVD